MTPSLTTKEALLKAAHDLFVQRGYEGVSTRDITNAAKANLASIPYYFGSKAELFVETVKYALSSEEEMGCTISSTHASDKNTCDQSECLHKLLHTFIGNLLCENKRQSICLVMYREILSRNPETAEMRKQLTQFFYETLMKPLAVAIRELVVKINPTLGEKDCKNISHSIIAQCVFFASHEPFFEYDLGHSVRNEAFVKEASSHAFKFSIAAIKSFNG